MGPRVRLLNGVMFVLSWPSQQPSTALIWGPSLACHGPLEGCGHTALCILPLQTKLKKRRGKRAKSEEVKSRMKNRGIWCLGSWLLSIKGPPSLLLWRERGEEGGGSECIPLSSCPGGVSTLAAERGMKAALSPCRHAGLGWLMLCLPNSKQRQRGLWVHHFPSAQRSDWPERSLVHHSHYTWMYSTKPILIARIKVLL